MDGKIKNVKLTFLTAAYYFLLFLWLFSNIGKDAAVHI